MELNPLAAGILDGAFESSPAGLFKLAYDLTDAKFRSDLMKTFSAISNDPIGVLGSVCSEYKDVIDRVMSGKATEADMYLLGNELGSLATGLLTGGGISKIIKKLEKAPGGKVVNSIDEVNNKKSNTGKKGMPAWVKEGKDFENQFYNKLVKKGVNVTRQVSFTAIDPKTGQKVRAVVDFVIKNEDGSFSFIETKLSSTTKLTKNQEIVYKALKEGKATAVGEKAAQAGLSVGKTYKAEVKIESKIEVKPKS